MIINQVRRFNRFYSRILGVFNKNVFDLNYSLVEMRILGEINRNSGTTAIDLIQFLDIDKSYISRILSKLEKDNLIYRRKDGNDNRKYHLFLSEKGEKLNQYVELKSDQKIKHLLKGIDAKEIESLVASMQNIENILGKVVVKERKEEK